mgnify:FL=1
MSSALYATDIDIGGGIHVRVPTVGEVIDHHDEYMNGVYSIVATPYDLMAQLADVGIDFTTINSFDLFCLTFPHIKTLDTSLIFGDLDLSQFYVQIDESTNDIIIRNPQDGMTIDRVVHQRICECLRKMLHIPHTEKKPGNDEAKKYMIERARARMKRSARSRKAQPKKPILESYIVALVNTQQFPYNYETVRGISIYQFYSSLTQIMHKVRYDNTMIGYYTGNIKSDDLKQEDKTWLLMD